MANVHLVDLAKQYLRGNGVIRSIDGVTLDIDKGEFVALIGRVLQLQDADTLVRIWSGS
jgi:ABC-type phosphate/phosphonate transport system ATPase subunit